MSANTKIEWADHTFNPWVGCTKVSPGCDHCYAEGWAKRAGKAAGVTWGGERRRTSEENWRQPLRWNAQAERESRRYRVFCASLADVFDNQVPTAWRVDLFRLIAKTTHLDWSLLTKRIGNARQMLNEVVDDLSCGINTWDELPWPGVWIGATVVNQEEADRDIPKLLAVPARVRFLSIEPMLGDIRLGSWLQRSPSAAFAAGRVTPDMPAWTRIGSTAIDWVICGGESGPHARPMHPDWARSLRDQCAAADVPFLFKQWGEYTAHGVDPDGYNPHLNCIDAHGRDCALSRGELARAKGEPWWHLPAQPGRPTWGPDGIPPGVLEIRRVGKKAAGRLLDGVEHDGFPNCRRLP